MDLFIPLAQTFGVLFCGAVGVIFIVFVMAQFVNTSKDTVEDIPAVPVTEPVPDNFATHKSEMDWKAYEAGQVEYPQEAPIKPKPESEVETVLIRKQAQAYSKQFFGKTAYVMPDDTPRSVLDEVADLLEKHLEENDLAEATATFTYDQLNVPAAIYPQPESKPPTILDKLPKLKKGE